MLVCKGGELSGKVGSDITFKVAIKKISAHRVILQLKGLDFDRLIKNLHVMVSFCQLYF